MNYLAHLYLSDNNESFLIGNYVADHVRGKDYFDFSPNIQKGILLHRAIDEFTDQHEITRQSKERLHHRYRHYKGVIIDIFYDYFLAKHWEHYSEIPLRVFTKSIYKFLSKHKNMLPQRSIRFLEYMIAYDILFNYQYFEGIDKVLQGMNQRTKGKSKMNLAIDDLISLEKEFEGDFFQFFIELNQFSTQKRDELYAK